MLAGAAGAERSAGALQPGKRYAARVVKMMDYGAFVELSGGSQGLLHISEIAAEKVPPPSPPACICPSSVYPRGTVQGQPQALMVQQESRVRWHD